MVLQLFLTTLQSVTFPQVTFRADFLLSELWSSIEDNCHNLLSLKQVGQVSLKISPARKVKFPFVRLFKTTTWISLSWIWMFSRKQCSPGMNFTCNNSVQSKNYSPKALLSLWWKQMDLGHSLTESPWCQRFLSTGKHLRISGEIHKLGKQEYVLFH